MESVEELIADDHESKHASVVCQICNKSFSTEKIMKQLKNVQEEFEKFPCLMRQKTFSLAGNLKTHKLAHTQGRPHQCTYCKNTFALAENLRIHQHTHTHVKLIVQCVENLSHGQVVCSPYPVNCTVLTKICSTNLQL